MNVKLKQGVRHFFVVFICQNYMEWTLWHASFFVQTQMDLVLNYFSRAKREEGMGKGREGREELRMVSAILFSHRLYYVYVLGIIVPL